MNILWLKYYNGLALKVLEIVGGIAGWALNYFFEKSVKIY